MKQVLTVFLLTFALTAGCADAAQSDRNQRVSNNGSDCIWIRTIRDYTPLDDQNLLVRGPGNWSYLVTLQYRSFDLKSSFGLGFSSLDDQLCPYGGDAIILDGLSRESVRIRAISKVSSEQAEQLMVQFGKSKPKEQQTPAPQPVEGAEVEELD